MQLHDFLSLFIYLKNKRKTLYSRSSETAIGKGVAKRRNLMQPASAQAKPLIA
jgi:hypothetical protein